MKVCFETFGCRLNRAEALDQEAVFQERGWTRTETHSDADLIVIRGCSVTQRAQRDCERLIEHLKSKYPLKKLMITGCLPDAKKDLVIRDVSARNSNRRLQTPDSLAGTSAPVPTRTSRAYLKVQDGCAGKCTFCTVPKFRGESVSFDFDSVLARARQFIDAGYHEIVVTGCNLSLYASRGKRLDALLAALAELSPDCRIRLGSLEPTSVAADVIRTMAEHANICRFLHIPVQSGSNRTLVAMKRPYSVKDVEQLVRQAREAMPNVALGCDLMTGFPDELELDFLATKGLLSRLPFSRVHVFPYSERPGTVAAALPGKVPKQVRHARAAELMRLADSKRTSAARRFLGQRVELVVEDEKTGSGWTSEYFWCTCPNAHVARKSLLPVRVTGVDGHVLTGARV